MNRRRFLVSLAILPVVPIIPIITDPFGELSPNDRGFERAAYKALGRWADNPEVEHLKVVGDRDQIAYTVTRFRKPGWRHDRIDTIAWWEKEGWHKIDHPEYAP